MNNSEWLTAENFEYAHRAVSAINTLSIHAKLLLAGKHDAPRSAEVREARSFLREFLKRLDEVIRDAQQRRGTVVGTDPRSRELASKFVSAKSRMPRRSVLYSTPIDELQRLVDSERSADLSRLISALRELRVVIEQHAHTDIAGILGDV